MKFIAASYADLANLSKNWWKKLRPSLNAARQEAPPIHLELFNLEQLERHAQALARRHQVGPRIGPDLLLPRLTDNETLLIQVYEALSTAVQNKQSFSPAGEWLLDNFHLIEEQIKTARRHLPRGYSKELPHLTHSASAMYPRVYDIALEVIAHVDGHIDHENIKVFVSAYQKVNSLTLGEFWAIPIMLRLALIENLRRVGVRVMIGMEDRQKASYWADQLISASEKDPKSLILIASDMARSNPPLSNSFVAEFVRRLQGRGPTLDIPLSWLEHQLAENGSSVQQTIQTETRQQASNQVSVSASISSLRFLEAIDWREFVEGMSDVEHILCGDPAQIYERMTFDTRDQYRHVVERLARRSGKKEVDVAQKAIQLAASHPQDHEVLRKDILNHVGYYLVDKGKKQLEEALELKPSLRSTLRLTRSVVSRVPLYLGAVLLGTLAVTTWIVVRLGLNRQDFFIAALLSVALFLISSQMVVSFVNWVVTWMAPPKLMPRLDFTKGIPNDARTIVAVPCMLFSRKNVAELLESLEVRYLANRETNLFFGLVTDFSDAKIQTLPGDAALLEQAKLGILELNQKYSKGDATVFFLFHRERLWNGQEKLWMGYERKRGKLEALNTFLRRTPASLGPNPFTTIVGNTSILSNIKYVLTLDADTGLPRESARKLIGTMAHPLNHPAYDPQTGRISEGYGILQPRVDIRLPGARRSWFTRIYSGSSGIDPYTRAVSDVYQDLFGEGSFIGKGIYDIDAFSAVLSEKLPENLILSHDLLEGNYARSGLVSDVLLYEEFPYHYSDDIKRRHRWTRGDWQIWRWMFSTVPSVKSRFCSNPLSLLGRWKIFDNLRRSFVPPALFVVLAMGWLVVEDLAVFSAIFVGLLFLPSVLTSFAEALRKPTEAPLRLHLRSVARKMGAQLLQSGLTLAFLPHEAYIQLHAIGTSWWRMCFVTSGLLEWQSASTSGQGIAKSHPWSFIRTMFSAPVVSLLLIFLYSKFLPSVLPYAGPILVLWFFSPGLAWWLSRLLPESEVDLSAEQTAYLQQLSRRTWRFFEEFIGDEDHWLPPDNFQEQPVAVVAHRTSPTNIGLSVLANLSAYDFGYISASSLITRTTKTFQTLEKMERLRGHFYNWYDTQTLKPLLPMYISTVDSGNFSGLLLTLKVGLQELAQDPILAPAASRGIQSTLQELMAALNTYGEALNGPYPAAYAVCSKTLVSLQELKRRFDQPLQTVSELAVLVDRVNGNIRTINHLTQTCKDTEVLWWAKSLERQHQEAFVHALNLLQPLRTLLREVVKLPPSEQMEELRQTLLPLDSILSWRQLAMLRQDVVPLLDGLNLHGISVEEREIFSVLRSEIYGISSYAADQLSTIAKLSQQCEDLAAADYEFLYDKSRHLLSIGYNVNDHRLEAGFYDLLASEARLCSFVAVAQGQLPQEHWFSLGRLLTESNGDPTLLSWSGSMFEYLMPQLIMPTYKNTLLDQTYRTCVKRQIEYGRQRGVPWGISESGYNTTDVNLNYQYRAFGVPGLGFKRGLAEDLVIAPYATILALMVLPEEACSNLQNMRKLGFEGKFGFYEAIDYTPSRLGTNQTHAVVRSYMAHHQGMSLLALAHHLQHQKMPARFLANPYFQATELLLHERVPHSATFYPHTPEVEGVMRLDTDKQPILRVINTPHTPRPEVHLLSNGRYSVMLTNSGGSSSQWNDLAVTRWREDPTCDSWGTFCYIRDVKSQHTWSAAYQPTQVEADHYEAIFPEAKGEYRRRDDDIEMHTEITVSPEDDIELRRLSITNLSGKTRILEITSYAEVVLTPQRSDDAHPAFSKLFVQTEILQDRHAILCSRRPRSDHEKTPLMVHLMSVHGKMDGGLSFETDRTKFIGRGRTVKDPQVMSITQKGDLSGSQGSVLDPIVAIRCRIVLAPDQTSHVHIVTGMSETREEALRLTDKYHDRNLADRVFDLAWTHRQVILRQLNISESDASLYSRLASSILYATPQRRVSSATLIKNRRGQSTLWGYGISGDLPIVLLRIASKEKIDLVYQLVQAHGYWSMMGLKVDLVILNDDDSGYRQDLQELILGMIAASASSQKLDKPAGIFIRRAEQMPDEDRTLLQTIARAVLSDIGGTLFDQVDRRSRKAVPIAAFVPTSKFVGDEYDDVFDAKDEADLAKKPLILGNRHGGFTQDGTEYVITTTPGSPTPAPWVNVLANPFFGSVVSESGSAYTWCENAHEFRLTPWNNDALTDNSGEAFYLRDEETGLFWSPTPLPATAPTTYVTRHGFGYSLFRNTTYGIDSTLTTFVAIDAPIKISLLKLRNGSDRTRKISLTGYCEWVLGELRTNSLLHVVSESDPASGALFARNHYHAEFGGRIGFFDVSDSNRTFTADRTEFVGRNGCLSSPLAMQRAHLSGRVGAGLDACAAMQTTVTLAPGEEYEMVFVLGVARDVDDARTLLRRFRSVPNATHALTETQKYWKHTLGAVQVNTPDPALNALANGWLIYQVLASRLWARSGFYQSGGAYGFRDQLQDTMALLHSEPSLLRAQILRCASRQFREGDVQHWWHPPSGRGVRTHFSDDYLWLPLATSLYVLSIGDTGVLEERIRFIEGRNLRSDEEAYADLPTHSDESATLYEHCVRAINRSLKFGRNGLPLIGCGDWNDGMNLVGEQGKGESVWLGFFLFDILRKFSRVATQRGDIAFAERCLTHATELQKNLEANTWDGEWYRRAYFDNGEPLGSATRTECQIDSLPQSWAVLSKAGDPARARMAMNAVGARLIDRKNAIVKLFDPPFDKSEPNPGYIKGYVPGVRENGGQYTHAAIWVAMAFAELGDNEKAWELFHLINPIRHSDTPEKEDVYKVEPYVVAADVYAVAPHTGRGGWTWYTGSAAWMYRLILETLLGLRLEVDRLYFKPCLPESWRGKGFDVRYRYRETFYQISVRKRQDEDHQPLKLIVDGVLQDVEWLPLVDDRKQHYVEVMLS